MRAQCKIRTGLYHRPRAHDRGHDPYSILHHLAERRLAEGEGAPRAAGQPPMGADFHMTDLPMSPNDLQD